MKEYVCVQVTHHKKIANTIQEYLLKGWHLHTYQTAGFGTEVKHYILFERG